MKKIVKGQIEKLTDGKFSICGYVLSNDSKIKLFLCDKWVKTKLRYEVLKCGSDGYCCNLDGLIIEGRLAKAYIKI